MIRIFPCIFLLILVSCSKENRVGQSEFMLNVDIEQAALATKVVINRTEFANGDNMGIFVYNGENVHPHTSLRPYNDKYKNVKAMRLTTANRLGDYQYTFNGYADPFYKLYFMSSPTETYTDGLTFYAYAPWNSGAESITSIPFKVGGKSKSVADLMYAIQNTEIDLSKNNACIEPDGEDKQINFTFRHSMALLKFRLKCRYENSKMSVSSITLKSTGEDKTPLYVSGNYNALKNEFFPVEGQTVTTDYSDDPNEFDNTEYKDYYFLIVPVDTYDDCSYEVVFNLQGQTLKDTYQIRASDLLPKESTGQAAFKAGYTYTFNFVIDNYIQIDGVSVSDQWSTGEPINVIF